MAAAFPPSEAVAAPQEDREELDILSAEVAPKVAPVRYFSRDFCWNEWAEVAAPLAEAVPLLSTEPDPGSTNSNAIHSSGSSSSPQEQCWEDFFRRDGKSGSVYRPRRYLATEFNIQPSEGRGSALNMIDIGCGFGCSLLPLLEADPHLQALAVDFSPHAIHLLRAHPLFSQFQERLATHVHDALALGAVVAPSSADAALAIFTCSALQPKDHALFFREAAACLKPGTGRLLFRDYGLYDNTQMRNKKRVGERTYLRGGEQGQGGGGPTIAHYFTLAELSQLATQAGLEVEEVEYCCVASVNRKKGQTTKRVFIHGKFRRPQQESEPPSSVMDVSRRVLIPH